MFVANMFSGIRLGGAYHGVFGTFIRFGSGVTRSPTKLVNQVVKNFSSKSVFLIGEVAKQPDNELALLIGDLRDLQRSVVIELQEREMAGPVAGLASWISVVVQSHPPVARSNEIVWIVDARSSFDLTKHNVTGPVYVIPKTQEVVLRCFEILRARPQWKYASELSVLEERVMEEKDEKKSVRTRRLAEAED